MNTWQELFALTVRDPASFAWLIVTVCGFWATTVGGAFWLAYWLRGQHDEGKIRGFEQRMYLALEKAVYVQERADDAAKAYEAERQLRANQEKPEVIEQSSKSTENAIGALERANTEFKSVLTTLTDFKEWFIERLMYFDPVLMPRRSRRRS